MNEKRKPKLYEILQVFDVFDDKYTQNMLNLIIVHVSFGKKRVKLSLEDINKGDELFSRYQFYASALRIKSMRYETKHKGITEGAVFFSATLDKESGKIEFSYCGPDFDDEILQKTRVY